MPATASAGAPPQMRDAAAPAHSNRYGRAPVRLESFDVISRDPLPRAVLLEHEGFGSLGSQTEPPKKAREHLRLYYSDYLRVPVAEGLKFMDQEETEFDCDDLVAWTTQAEPRTRVDAYPLLVMCRDLLRRLAQRELRVLSRRADALAAELARERETVEMQNEELKALRDAQVPKHDI
jgi:hypothetical protein